MIKRTVAMFAIASLVLTTSCKENAALRIDEETAKEAEIAHADAGKIAVMKFDEVEHDFGTIDQGEVVSYTFTFKNEGTSDLVVSKAKASCGCTVPSYTKTPVKPGETGEVNVEFNSKGKKGNQNKTVTVSANTEEGSQVLKFKAVVTPKEGEVATKKAK